MKIVESKTIQNDNETYKIFDIDEIRDLDDIITIIGRVDAQYKLYAVDISFDMDHSETRNILGIYNDYARFAEDFHKYSGELSKIASIGFFAKNNDFDIYGTLSINGLKLILSVEEYSDSTNFAPEMTEID